MAHGVRRITATILGIIIADTVLRYIAPAFGIRVGFSADEFTFIVFGALCTALVADIVYKQSYKTLEEKYIEDSKVISKRV